MDVIKTMPPHVTCFCSSIQDYLKPILFLTNVWNCMQLRLFYWSFYENRKLLTPLYATFYLCKHSLNIDMLYQKCNANNKFICLKTVTRTCDLKNQESCCRLLWKKICHVDRFGERFCWKRLRWVCLSREFTILFRKNSEYAPDGSEIELLFRMDLPCT